MVCTSLGSLLRPLFYFLCSILLIHRVWYFWGEEGASQDQFQVGPYKTYRVYFVNLSCQAPLPLLIGVLMLGQAARRLFGDGWRCAPIGTDIPVVQLRRDRGLLHPSSLMRQRTPKIVCHAKNDLGTEATYLGTRDENSRQHLMES